MLLIGDNLQVNGMSITTLPVFLPGQIATNAILSVKASAKANITGYSYTPVLQTYSLTQKYNCPFGGWNPTSNVNATVTLNWPKSIPLPKTGNIITSSFQSAGSAYNNSVKTVYPQ